MKRGSCVIVRSLIAVVAAGVVLAGCGSGGTGVTGATDAREEASLPSSSVRAPAPAIASETAPAPVGEVAPSPAPRAYDHEVTSSEGHYRVSFSSEPAAIPLNEVFDLAVCITDADGMAIQGVDFDIDARMPDHRHGMLRAPRVEPQADGRFAVSGMLFHMPGRWEIHFDLTTRGLTERAQWEIELE